MTTVFCKHCAAQYDAVAGDFPVVCPHCDQPAFWTTEPVPVVAWTVNENDKLFLRSLRITPKDTD